MIDFNDWTTKHNADIMARESATERRLQKRDELYYGFRYANDSYKSRKAMIRPYLMTARRDGGGALKLYDDGSHQPTKEQEKAMTTKCRGWRAQERTLKQAQRKKRLKGG